MLNRKDLTADFKALPDEAPGTFTALVAAYGNVDSVGDRIMPGAFDKSLTALRKSGDPLPIVLAHQWADPFAHIGVAQSKDIKSTEQGLVVKARLDMENPTAAQVYKLMQRRSLKEFSIGYLVQDEAMDDKGVNNLNQIDLREAGPCLVGANSATQLLGIKSALADLSDAPTAEEMRSMMERLNHIMGSMGDHPADMMRAVAEMKGDDVLLRILDAEINQYE